MKLSIIIPCYNSMPILKTMIAETARVLSTLPIDEREFILVNDCSPRRETITFLKEIADTFPDVRVLDLAKNTGQANAQLAALNFVSGDIVLNMDDDMQTHPKNIPLLFDKLMEGYDLVLGCYPHKQHSFYRRLLTKMDDWFETIFLKKPRELRFTSFWIVRRYIVDELVKYENSFSFMEGLFLRTAGKIANVEVEHFDRMEGKSGYDIWKLVSLWSNFTGFTILPLRIAGALGMVISVVSFLWAIVMAVCWFLGNISVQGYTSIMCILLLSLGLILVCMGLLGEYIGRIYLAVNHAPQFVVKEMYGFEKRERDTTPFGDYRISAGLCGAGEAGQGAGNLCDRM